MLLDLHNSIKVSRGVSPIAAVTNDTPFVSQILDTNGFGTAEFIGITGTLTDADTTLTVLVEDGNDSALADNAAVDDAYLLGVEAMGLQYDSDNKTFKIGYIGPKRYVRVTITSANNTGNLFIAGAWLQTRARKQPQSTQVN